MAMVHRSLFSNRNEMLLLFSASFPRSCTGRFLWHMMNIQFDENVKPIQIEVTSDFLRARKGLYSKGICGLVLLRVRGCVPSILTESRCIQPTYILCTYIHIYVDIIKHLFMCRCFYTNAQVLKLSKLQTHSSFWMMGFPYCWWFRNPTQPPGMSKHP